MTSVLAWQRDVGGPELLVASDSRLGGGEDWDACAKIFDVGRGDAVLAFAGHTWRALPLVLQVVATTRSYRGSELRTLDVPEYAFHLERVLNTVLGEARGVAAKEPPDCEFLLGGWSWKLGRFRVYRYKFDRNTWRFKINPAPQQTPKIVRGPGRGRIFTGIGDGTRRLIGRLARGYNAGEITGPFDYHPLEQLYQQAVDPKERTVGGPVQIAKVYRSVQVEHFATQVDGARFVSGRPVLEYENLDLRSIVRQPDGSWVTKVTQAKSDSGPAEALAEIISKSELSEGHLSA